MYKDPLGLILCGGGGKGSYQIGAWKAIQEAGIQTSYVSGTSVGALNAALVAQGDIKKAEAAWLSLTNDKMMTINAESLTTGLLESGKTFGLDGDFLSRLGKKLQNSTVIDHLSSMGILSRKGLEQILGEYLDYSLFRKGIPTWSCSHNHTRKEICYFPLNGTVSLSDLDIQDRLLASSALPLVFGKVIINGDDYLDGGGSLIGAVLGKEFEKKYAFDNTPIFPVYESGCKEAIIILLEAGEKIDRERFPGMRLLPLAPSQSLGELKDGLMDFSSEGARWRMELGYSDMKALLSKLGGIRSNNQEYEELWTTFESRDKDYDKSMNRLNITQKRSLDTSSEIRDFNRIVFEDTLNIPLESELPRIRGALEEKNRQVLDAAEREQIKIWADDFVEKNRDNSTMLENFLLEGVGFMSPVEARATQLGSKKFLARIKGSLDGSTNKAVADSISDLARAQMAFLRVQEAMQRQGLIAMELQVALHSKITQISNEIVSTNERLDERTRQVYSSLALVYSKLRNELCEHREILEDHEIRLSVTEWIRRLANDQFEGSRLKELRGEQSLPIIANSFFHATKGKWNPKNLRDYLDQIKLYVPESLEAGKLGGPEFYRSLYAKLARTGDNYGITCPLTVSPTSLVCREEASLNALAQLKYNGWAVSDVMPVSRHKEVFLSALNSVRDIIREFELDTSLLAECENLETKIRDFKMTVPLFGLFSSGKTTLINTWIGKSLFTTNLAPETAVALELHYDKEEYLLPHYRDGRKSEKLPFSGPESFSNIASGVKDLLFLELHADLPALARYPDLVITDMPGFDSSIGIHEQAIANYMKSATYGIVCIAVSEGTIKRTILHKIAEMGSYGIPLAALFTKIDQYSGIKLEDSIDSILETFSNELYGVEPIHGAIAAKKQDMEGWNQVLDTIDSEKGKVFQAHFGEPLTALTKRISGSLELLLNRDNLQINDLEAKKREISSKIADLKKVISDEFGKALTSVDHMAGECGERVYRTLDSMIHVFCSEILAGQSVNQHILVAAKNSCSIAVSEIMKERCSKIAASINRYVKDQSYVGGFADFSLPDVNVSLPEKNLGDMILDFVEKIPIIGDIVKLFRSNNTEGELRKQLANAFSTIKVSVVSESKKIFEEGIRAFFTELQKKADVMESELKTTLTRIEEQLSLSVDEQDKRTKRLREVIGNLSQETGILRE